MVDSDLPSIVTGAVIVGSGARGLTVITNGLFPWMANVIVLGPCGFPSTLSMTWRSEPTIGLPLSPLSAVVVTTNGLATVTGPENGEVSLGVPVAVRVAVAVMFSPTPTETGRLTENGPGPGTGALPKKVNAGLVPEGLLAAFAKNSSVICPV